MSNWVARRFWQDVEVKHSSSGWKILLDQYFARTPGKSILLLPARSLAEQIASEWSAQDSIISIQSMPFTRLANTAIDKVSAHTDEIVRAVVAYGDSDLLCYRADKPEELIRRQSENWDMVLAWAVKALGIRLEIRYGVIHRSQPLRVIRTLEKHVRSLTPFHLTAFFELVTLSGSIVLAFAAIRNWRETETIWQLSRLDELWQEELWGRDNDAQQATEIKKTAFCQAKLFFDLASDKNQA
ncbi:MAG: ATPase [Aestuariivita sp.]|nr:ATPase [Aestuariivita sp.]